MSAGASSSGQSQLTLTPSSSAFTATLGGSNSNLQVTGTPTADSLVVMSPGSTVSAAAGTTVQVQGGFGADGGPITATIGGPVGGSGFYLQDPLGSGPGILVGYGLTVTSPGGANFAVDGGAAADTFQSPSTTVTFLGNNVQVNLDGSDSIADGGAYAGSVVDVASGSQNDSLNLSSSTVNFLGSNIQVSLSGTSDNIEGAASTGDSLNVESGSGIVNAVLGQGATIFNDCYLDDFTTSGSTVTNAAGSTGTLVDGSSDTIGNGANATLTVDGGGNAASGLTVAGGSGATGGSLVLGANGASAIDDIAGLAVSDASAVTQFLGHQGDVAAQSIQYALGPKNISRHALRLRLRRETVSWAASRRSQAFVRCKGNSCRQIERSSARPRRYARKIRLPSIRSGWLICAREAVVASDTARRLAPPKKHGLTPHNQHDVQT